MFCNLVSSQNRASVTQNKLPTFQQNVKQHIAPMQPSDFVTQGATKCSPWLTVRHLNYLHMIQAPSLGRSLIFLFKNKICFWKNKIFWLSVYLKLDVCTVCKWQVWGGLDCTYLLLLGLDLQEDGWLLQRQKLGWIVMKRREFCCSDVIQVFPIPLPPDLCGQRRRAFRRLAGWWWSWGRDVTFVGQSGNTLKRMLFQNNT